MAKFMVALPFPAGGTDKWHRFAGEVLGPRRAEHDASRARFGITEERCWLQGNPDGGQTFILYLVGRDPVEGNRRFAASTDPYDVWFKDEAGELLGVDLGQPIPVNPTPVYSSAPPNRRASQAVALVTPILPGATARWLEMVAEVNGPRRAEHDGFHARVGVGEDWYHQQTPAGDLKIIYLEGADIGAAVGGLAASQHPHDLWFKAELMAADGIDWSRPPAGPLPELVLDYQAR